MVSGLKHQSNVSNASYTETGHPISPPWATVLYPHAFKRERFLKPFVIFKSKKKCFKVTVKTKHCVNSSILLWQHVSVLLDHLQASMQRYEVQSVHIMYCGIPYYLKDVYKIV